MAWCPSTQLPDATVASDVHRSWFARLVHWVVEARSHRVICLVFGIWLLNGFDLAFTILSHEQGMLQEQNPVARHLLRHGTATIILFKTGLVLIGSYPLLRFRTARVTELAAYTILAAYALLAIHWSTCYEFYAITPTDDLNLAEIANTPVAPPQ